MAWSTVVRAVSGLGGKDQEDHCGWVAEWQPPPGRVEGAAYPVLCSSDLVRNSESPDQVLLHPHMCLPTGKG